MDSPLGNLPTLTARRAILALCMLFAAAIGSGQPTDNGQKESSPSAEAILARVRRHDFHPIRNGFTYDRHLDTHGVADLDDRDGVVRTLAVGDLVRMGNPAAPRLIAALEEANPHVRHVAAMVLGIVRARESVQALEHTLGNDPDEVVRAQAAVALGQIGNARSLPVLLSAQAADASRDVTHQAELAVYAIEHNHPATPELALAHAGLDETDFNRVKVGEPAPDFELPDTDGQTWRLSAFRGKAPVVLVWIFADWCPVCHGEFRELIELRDDFRTAGIEVATLECHDLYPARVMVGKELEPDYWFSSESFRQSYAERVWWPHLVDRAAGVGAIYGVRPMAFTVHAEWINRPAVVIVDRQGIVRFTYYGTFWGDRPSIREILEMVRTQNYEFRHPKRLTAGDPAADGRKS